VILPEFANSFSRKAEVGDFEEWDSARSPQRFFRAGVEL